MRASAAHEAAPPLSTPRHPRSVAGPHRGNALRAKLQSSIVLTLLGFVFGTILWFTVQPFPEAAPEPPETTGSMVLSWQ